MIVKVQILEYNHIYAKIPGVFDNPIILNLHLLLWDSYIAVCNVRPPFAAEGSAYGCGYPPSFARSQNIGNGILGVTKEKREYSPGILSYCINVLADTKEGETLWEVR